MQPIIVTAATEREIDQLVREIKAQPLAGASPRKIWQGKIGDCPILLALTGIGKVNAGSTATSLIEKFRPRLLVNTGCGGAYGQSGLQVGELAVATAEIYGDEGVLTTDGWHSLELIGIPAVERKGNRYSNEFPLSLEAAGKAFQLAISLGLPIRRGKFITVSTCSGTALRGAELFGRFRGICENMEGAAIAHVALLYEVDCLEVRGISNMVEDRDLVRWDIPLAVEMAQRFLHKYLKQICTGSSL
jgi:futalosine hydrolase